MRQLDPRDERDLEVLAQRERGARVKKIAELTGVSPDIVETILAADAEAFPHEPLTGRA